MPSAEHEAFVALLQAAPAVTEAPSLAEQRQNYDAMLGNNPVAEDVVIESTTVADCAADWVSTPNCDQSRALLYFHGGGYVIGSNIGYREFAGRLARATGIRTLVLNYRLAPEHPFPAAVDDAAAAYRWLLASGFTPDRIMLAGDSAGGGLVLAALLALRDAGDALPAGGVSISPWVDLACTGESNLPGAVDDPLIAEGTLESMRDQYAPDSATDPLVSPLYAELAGLPPLFVLAGTREVLIDDAVRLVERARAAGLDVEYFEGADLMHVWPVMVPGAPESEDALAQIAAFTAKRCPG